MSLQNVLDGSSFSGDEARDVQLLADLVHHVTGTLSLCCAATSSPGKVLDNENNVTTEPVDASLMLALCRSPDEAVRGRPESGKAAVQHALGQAWFPRRPQWLRPAIIHQV